MTEEIRWEHHCNDYKQRHNNAEQNYKFLFLFFNSFLFKEREVKYNAMKKKGTDANNKQQFRNFIAPLRDFFGRSWKT